MSRRQLFAALTLGFFAGAAAAAPVTYSESVSGDLPSGPIESLVNVGTLDPGLNTVSGTYSWFKVGLVDEDSFTFDVPVGFNLTSVVFHGLITLPGGTSSVDNGQAGFELLAQAVPFWTSLGGSHVTILSSSPMDTRSMFTFGLPAESNRFALTQSGVTMERAGEGSTAIGFFVDYQFDLLVEPIPVPLPAAGWLLLSGIGLLSRFRRRSYLLPALEPLSSAGKSPSLCVPSRLSARLPSPLFAWPPGGPR